MTVVRRCASDLPLCPHPRFPLSTRAVIFGVNACRRTPVAMNRVLHYPSAAQFSTLEVQFGYT